MHFGSVLEESGLPELLHYELRDPAGERKFASAGAVYTLQRRGLFSEAELPKVDGVRRQLVLSEAGRAAAASMDGRLPL